MSNESELRQRKKTSSDSIGDTTENYAEQLGSMAPTQLKPYIQAAIPYVKMLAEFLESLVPLLDMCRRKLVDFWVLLKPYKPDLLLPAFAGIIMCFFGGTVMHSVIGDFG